MSETIYPKGIRVFKKNDKQPDFVKGTVVITLNELHTFCKENESLLTEYSGKKQLKCQLLEGNNGLYMAVDTWKPTRNNDTFVDDSNDNQDLPF